MIATVNEKIDLGRVGVDAEYANRTQTLAIYSLRNRSRQTRDTFALAATHGRQDAEGLVQLVKTLFSRGDTVGGEAFLAEVSWVPFINFCSTFAAQARTEQEIFDASTLLEAAFTWRGRNAFRSLDRLVLPELLAWQRRWDDLQHWMSVLGVAQVNLPQTFLLRANAINPFTQDASEGADQEHWLALVNAVFAADGVEAIDIAPGDQPAFDRIVCAPSSHVVDGPKVSIIVPTYEPDVRIESALESLLAQSYQNVEILIMDDASSIETAAQLDGWERRDPRIRVIHLRENLGSYKARNVAVAEHATGAYVTVHDDDDWSHPRKIEMQVANLEANPNVPANTSLLSRATNGLLFTRINDNPIFCQRNYSSLMVRRSVFDSVGYWDVVNRAADAEMVDRIQLWWGQRVPTVGTAPLSFLRERSLSLTSGEISRGYLDPRRRWYADAYRRWHAACAHNGTTPYIGQDDRVDRPFPAPVSMLGSRARGGRTDVDVLYATEFRFPGGNSTLACNELEILLAHGYRIGLLQIESPILGPRNQIHPRLLEIARHPNVSVVSLLDDVRADLLLLRHPTTMQFVEPVRSRIAARTAVLIVNHAPFEPDGTGSTYDVSTVLSNMEQVFGVRPLVAPESGVIRDLLGGLVAPTMMSDFDWNGVMRFDPPPVRSSDPTRRPVLGRHSRDHEHKWPTRDAFELVYPTDNSVDVRVLGGAAWAEKRVGKSLTDIWTVYAYGERPVRSFLDEVDIWAYFHGPELYESFGMAVLEAMSAGLVVVLPPYMRSTFGAGALYAEPEEARALYRTIWADRESYSMQSKRAIETARERFGGAALMARIASLLECGPGAC